MSYFWFSICKALRKVLFIEISEQRSFKGLILDVTEVFSILVKFPFGEITFLNS